MAAEAPPSYDSVTMAVLEKGKGGASVVEGVRNLSAEDRAIINAADLPPAYSDEEKQKIYDQMAKILSDDETLITVLKKSATKAVEACKKNEDMFNKLMIMLLKVDQENNIQGDAFVPKLKNLQSKYRGIIEESRKLAMKIAVYGTNFDEVVIVMCADQTLSTDERKEAIKDAIKEAQGFEAESKKIANDLHGALDEFNALAVSFSQWASQQNQQIDNDIARVQKELNELVDRLEHLKNLLIGFGVGAAIGAAGGLITLGFGVGLIATGVQFAACKSEIDAKNTELNALKTKKSNIEAARASLVAAAAVDAKDFAANIAAITNIWNAAQADAFAIQDWLQKGAKQAATPKYMAIQLTHGIRLYSKMSQYLTIYASGLDAASIPKPGSA
ncbi:hypothetical protein PG991_008121 [Apiospora marii]|uniref:Uncharacterized protein n=1 Tax=Apiospora marii TaxID=335849 RepID=A0ABR1RVF5_9PEZI